MIMSIANPFGGALGQVISPLVGTPRQSILVLAIICAAGTPLAFLIRDRPPTPPSLAGASHPSPQRTIKALFGLLPADSDNSASTNDSPQDALYMSGRERVDFLIVTLVFAALVASCVFPLSDTPDNSIDRDLHPILRANALALLSNEIFEPYGYSSDMAGLFGGTLLLAGIVSAIVTSPIFDRVLMHHFALACKILCPFIGLAWLSLVWAVRANNAGALFAIFAVIGICSLALLPLALELGVELTRNADTSASIMWGMSYIITIIFVLSASPLTASASANPPFNLRSLQILIGSVNVAFVCLIFGLRGKQTRRKMDEDVL